MLWILCALSALTFVVHTFVGGPVVVRPLLANDTLPKASKWLAYYCWHIATVMLAAVTIAAGWLVHEPSIDVKRFALVFFGALAAALSLLSAAVASRGGINPLRFPSTSLFAAIATVCSLALLEL